MSERRLTLGEVWHYRGIERRAFSWCFFALTIGYLAFFLSGGPERRSDWHNLIPLGIFAASLVLVHGVFLAARFQGDPGLVIPIVFLGGLGLLAQFRMGLFTPEDPWRLSQFAYPIGILTMLAITILFKHERYQWLRQARWIGALGALALVGGLIVTGSRFRGAVYASGNMTPTELIKVLVVVFLAGHLSSLQAGKSKRGKGSPPEFAALLPAIFFYGILFALLLWQRDLGMVVILGGLVVVMLVATTRRWRYVFGALLFGAGAGVGAYHLLLHSQQRFRVWLDPFVDPTGASWQLLQGLSGMFSGGLWGAGFGEGNPERIPIAASDFIYAVIGEELGYAGCFLVVVLFLGFFRRAFRVATLTANPYGALLTLGLATVIMLQTFLNIGGVTKTVPLTGIPLPFISHGGTSLVTMFICLGLILAVADGIPPQLKTPKQAKTTKRRHK
ncbi:MAG: putative FtsW-like protein [Verrucomicrobia subdivision 3 bacterium]|nr:putative FtsW-like protein [Limisphaerales bacterium]MCS1417286.1 putative FtsW-like protein [Limisphaerales bacterium]